MTPIHPDPGLQGILFVFLRAGDGTDSRQTRAYQECQDVQ
jgi:hypothetical protein